MPFRLSATYRLAPWLLAPSVISTNDFAYLPGLLAARPSAFVVGGGVEPPAHLSFFGESPPLWSDAVALVSAMVVEFPLFQFCLFAPTIQAFTYPIMSYPDLSLSLEKPANFTAGWENLLTLKTFSIKDVK